MKQQHILIIEDHQDVYENLERKINDTFPNAMFSIESSCDKGYTYIKEHKVTNPVTFLILDILFTDSVPKILFKNGRELMSKLNSEKIKIPTVVYSSIENLKDVHGIMKSYRPEGYVLKTNTSSNELLTAIEKIMNGQKYLSQEIHDKLLTRTMYSYELSETNKLITKQLLNTDSIKEWQGKIPSPNGGFLSYKTIKKQIDDICEIFGVDNQKQLVLKLNSLDLL